jgi:hypothetical protein
MTLDHIAHYLTCRDCQEALQRDPPAPRAEGQCSLALNDQDPPAWCPHPRAPGAEWCPVHLKAIAGARAAAAEHDELTDVVRQADDMLARNREKLREMDRAIALMRTSGTPEAELFAHVVNRDQVAGELGRVLAIQQEAVAALAAMGYPGADDPL